MKDIYVNNLGIYYQLRSLRLITSIRTLGTYGDGRFVSCFGLAEAQASWYDSIRAMNAFTITLM